MTVIYLDELFLLNFVVDYLLLLAAGRLSGEVLRRGWLALGAAIGAAYAAAAVLPGMGFLLHPLCKLGVAVLALLAGYGKSRRLLRVSLVFFAVSAAFGGGVFALQLLGAMCSSPCCSNAPPGTAACAGSWCLRCSPWRGGGWPLPPWWIRATPSQTPPPDVR